MFTKWGIRVYVYIDIQTYIYIYIYVFIQVCKIDFIVGYTLRTLS